MKKMERTIKVLLMVIIVISLVLGQMGLMTKASFIDSEQSLDNTLMCWSEPWYNTDWQYRRVITINHTKVSDVTDPSTIYADFPLLVYATGLSNINANGTDIRFTLSDGTTELSREIESYSGGTLYSWVKVTLTKDASDADDDVIYMYYGNTAATEPASDSTYGSENVWDSNYKGIWHLKESPNGTTDEIKDSTLNTNHGTTVNGMDATDSVPAKIGQGLDLDGSPDVNGDRIEVPDSSSLDSTNDEATIQMWLWWQNVADGDHQLIMTSSNRYTTGAKDGYEWASQGDGDHFFYPWGGSDSNYNITSGSPYTNQTWHHVVITLKDSTVREVDLYIDGNLVAWATENVPTNWTTLANPANWLWGGNPDRLTRHFDGVFDEIRVSDIRRSAEWIKTEYNNQDSPSSFCSVGAEE
jgi:hypothetical protein